VIFSKKFLRLLKPLHYHLLTGLTPFWLWRDVLLWFEIRFPSFIGDDLTLALLLTSGYLATLRFAQPHKLLQSIPGRTRPLSHRGHFAIIPAEISGVTRHLIYTFNVIHHLFEDGGIMSPPFRQFLDYYRSIYQICDYMQFFLKSFLLLFLSDHAPVLLLCLSPVESTPYTFESGIIFCISASNLSQYSNGVLSKTRFIDLLSGVFGNSASSISNVFVFNQFTYFPLA